MAYKKAETTTNVVEKTETKVTEEKEIKVEPKKYNNEDLIPCRSMVSGALYIEGARSKILYSWADCGDVIEIEYRDLIYMVRTREDVNIYSPRIIIEDDDFVEQNKAIKELYDSMYTVGDLREIIKLPTSQMKSEVSKLPIGAKTALKGIASTMIDAHTLDSVQKIKALDEIFGTQMLLTLVQE